MTTLVAPPTRPEQRPGGVADAKAPRRRPSEPLMVLPTLLGALAVLGGSTALFPLLDSTAWVPPLLEVVAVIWLAGIGARLLAIPAWGVELLQLAGLAIAVTSLFTTSGIAGVLPGPAAAREVWSMLGAAWHQILVSVPPAPTTPELELLVALSVGALALLVDLLIAGARTPALVALPLLSLFSVPASIDISMLPWYAFVLPAVMFSALLAVAGRSGWHLQPRARVSLGISGTAIAAITIIGALLLADSATMIGTAGRLPRGNHGGDVGLNPWALLHGDLQTSTPVETLVASGLSEPAYLRTFALEKWTPDEGFGFGPIVANSTDIDGAVPTAGPTRPGSGGITVTVTPKSYRDRYLPTYQNSTNLSGLARGWSYDQELQTVFRANPITPQPYTVTADLADVSAAELETENVHSGGSLTQTGTLPAAVVARARSITASAQTPFDAVRAMLTYFTDPANGFSYSLTVPTGNSGSALLDFLTNKKGYCEQYAAAMAIMLRAVGIPARVAVGFSQGTRQPDGSYLISSTDAHAWVEVKFDKSGWVSFDPTPVVDGQGGLQGYQDDGTGAGAGTPTSTNPSATATTAPAATRSLDGAVPTRGRQIPDGQTYQTAGPSAAPATAWGAVLLVAALVLAGLVAAGMILAAPSLVRRVRRRRRLGLASSGRSGAGSAAWAEIEDTLTDHGIAVHEVESARVTANRLARTAHLSTGERDELRTVVVTAEREWYGTPSAAEPDLAPGVRAVVDGLERSAPRRLSDRILPRSIRPGARRHR